MYRKPKWPRRRKTDSKPGKVVSLSADKSTKERGKTDSKLTAKEGKLKENPANNKP
jgi:hypothetical protein